MIWIFCRIHRDQNHIGRVYGIVDLVLDMRLEFVLCFLETGGVDKDVLVLYFADDVIAGSTCFARNNSLRLANKAIKETRFASIRLADDCDYR